MTQNPPTSFSPPIRVFCVDDHPVVRNGLRSMIESEEDLVMAGDAASAETAEALLLENALAGEAVRLQVDVLILDSRLPGRSGSEAVRFLRSSFPELKIVVLSSFAGDVEIRRCLEAGACDYVMKDAEPQYLLTAIRNAFFGPVGGAPTAEAPVKRLSELTNRECEILQLLAEGCRNKEIAHRAGIQMATVRWFAKSIYAKLGVNDRTEAVTLGLRRGIIVLASPTAVAASKSAAG